MIDHDIGTFDVVWNRRNKPAANMASLHPEDREIARTESTKFLRDLRALRPRKGQIWINKEYRQRSISLKPAQLALAHEVGLAIPNTLVSNDPARVRHFIESFGPAVVKALDKIAWEDEDGQIVLPTTIVSIDDCDDDLSIIACPMIYQNRIQKHYELRVVVFGDELLAVRLDSQAVEAARLDWRAAPPNSFAVEEIELPLQVADRLRDFCRRADVLHGSFDLAVTPDDETVFFEFNPQGQSLWIEAWNPNIRVLDRLTQFIAAPSRQYRYSPTGKHSFADYLDSEINEHQI